MQQKNKPDLENLKEILKPLIKQTVKEVILESGVLSKIISEVVSGLGNSTIVESRQQFSPPRKSKERALQEQLVNQSASERKAEFERDRQEKMQRLMAATGMQKVFSNIQPVQEEQTKIVSAEEKQELLEEKKRTRKEEYEDSQYGFKGGTALMNVDPGDPGVNINGILNLVGGKNTWKNQLKKKG